MGGQLWRNADPEALVQGHIAIYGSASASDELQLAAKVRADEHGVPLHQHQSMTAEEAADEDARLGRHLFVHYAEIGVLGPNCAFVHMNVLRDDEVEVIADSGSTIVWHPGNFMFYGIGAHQRTRMAELYERGVNIAFGTDIAKYWSIGEGPFLGYLVTREAGGYLPAESLFEMQTVNAARAVGFADRIGSLEAGKRADVVIRTDALADAQPGLNPVQEMVLIGRTKTVDTVIVDGQVVLRGGVPTRVDEGAVYAAARASARRLCERVGLAPATTWPMVQ
jgi:cytosine/adenosine deaminase-related metal-dependent hydrolase